MRKALVLVLLSACNKSTPNHPGGESPVVDVEFGIEERAANTTCQALPRPDTSSGLALEPAFPNLALNNPIALARRQLTPGDDTSWRWFVAEKGGQLRLVADPSDDTAATVLDIDVYNSGECGLLGFALDPDYTAAPGPGRHAIYVNYTYGTDGGTHDCPENLEGHRTCTFISRFDVTSSDGGATFDMGPEEILMRVQQPYNNHNGGNVLFGPDNLLYVAFGDGGDGGDPHCNAQNLTTPHGKMLRLDVRSGATPYAIPSDNPFASVTALCNDFLYDYSGENDVDVARAEACPEIFAWGLRNPWRFSFDRGTGALWLGDVGQGSDEEVSLIELGKNYGWPIREAARATGKTCAPLVIQGDLVDPLVQYGHSGGRSAITGGILYRGSALTPYVGNYFFSDSGSSELWAIANPYGLADVLRNPVPRLPGTGGVVVSFAEDEDGEIYVVNLYADSGEGVQRVVLDSGGGSGFPSALSQTGCVDPNDPARPASALIPYGLNAPFYSDGAEKQRYFALPDGTTIDVGDDGDFALPVGSVVMKVFRLNGKLLETRLLMHHDDGDWAGYTYVWNDAQTDAYLIDDHLDVTRDDAVWSFPSRSECLSCHTNAAGRTLGLEVAQLDSKFIYPGNRRAAQLTTLAHLGVFSADLPTGVLALTPPSGSDDLDARARAYLHANCSHCHRPGGVGVSMDLRATTTLADTHACDVAPTGGDFGIDNAQLIAPGDPDRSLILARIAADSGAIKMPPIGRNTVDEDGEALIRAWIASLAGCE